MNHDTAGCWPEKNAYTVYTVKRNETLCDILRKFDTSVRALKESNPECDLFSLRTGQVLTVQMENGGFGNSYVLRPHEDLSAVAEKFHQSVISLLKANPHLRPLEIREGIAINLPD